MDGTDVWALEVIAEMRRQEEFERTELGRLIKRMRGGKKCLVFITPNGPVKGETMREKCFR